MKIEFIPAAAIDRDMLLALSVAKGQETFVESVAECLEEAERYPCWRPTGIYVEDQLVGFTMYGLWEREGTNGRVWLDRYLIDRNYQGRGYGKACLVKLVQRLQKEYARSRIYLSVVEANPTAFHLYEAFGFRRNGERDIHNEAVMVLDRQI